MSHCIEIDICELINDFYVLVIAKLSVVAYRNWDLNIVSKFPS